ncbi:hypothetical protein [Marinobacter sp.]|uniref:hypothetical protein n=1 Tax=Marinobacter sp. TaxID=50741 RepID=UPI003A8CCF59
MKRTPATFVSNGREYVALSNVTHLTGIAAHIVTDAVSTGYVTVRQFNGCKVISLADVFRMLDYKVGGEA